MHEHHHLGRMRKNAHIQGILDEDREWSCNLGPQCFDFSFGEEECIRVRGLEILVYGVKIGG